MCHNTLEPSTSTERTALPNCIDDLLLRIRDGHLRVVSRGMSSRVIYSVPIAHLECVPVSVSEITDALRAARAKHRKNAASQQQRTGRKVVP